MKSVVNKNDVIPKMQEAINLLCDTVKITLGPLGRNVIVDNNLLGPIITNDGVTIAKEIESDDNVINTILTIAKEASIKTNEVVGDGTTTSLVMLQAIFNASLELIKSGYSPIILKKELDAGLKTVIKELQKMSKKLKKKDIYSLAKITSGDTAIGEDIYFAYQQIGPSGVITTEEGSNNRTSVMIRNGMQISSGFASPYFAKNKKAEVLDNPYILVTNYKIENISDITNILEKVIDKKRSLLIIADGYSEEVIETLLLNKTQKIIDVVAITSPNYALKKDNILEDICIFTNAKFINRFVGLKLNDIDINSLGTSAAISIDNEFTNIIDGCGNKLKIEKRVKELETEIKECSSKFDKEYLEERLAKLVKGVALIKVGGETKTDVIYQKLRIEDALCATKVALKSGVIPGGGLSYLKVRDILKNSDNSKGMKILLNSLKAPFEQILTNASVSSDNIYNEIAANNFTVGYDVISGKYLCFYENGIIDPLEVSLSALTNAVNIASLLLTTENIIVDNSLKTPEIDSEFSNIY